jgi:hypothetical protein
MVPPRTRAAVTMTSQTWRSGALLNKLSDGLLGCHDGSALCMLSKANISTNALVRILLDTFFSFHNYIELNALGVAPSGEWEAARGAGGRL